MQRYQLAMTLKLRRSLCLGLMAICFFWGAQVQAQLSTDEQAKINQAISNTTQQILLLQPFLNEMGLGDPIIETSTATTFKFKQLRSNITLATVLSKFSQVVGNDPLTNSFLNNPIMLGLQEQAGTTSLTATFTINNLNGTPSYSVSLLGQAFSSGNQPMLNFEFFFGNGSNSTDFVVGIAPAPGAISFASMHPDLKVLDGFVQANVGIFMTKATTDFTPEMGVLTAMGLEDLVLSTGLTAVANVNVEPTSELHRLFRVDRVLASVQIPAEIMQPLVLVASIQPDWQFSPTEVTLSDLSLNFQAGVGEGKPSVEVGASFTLNTPLPSSSIATPESARLVSDVKWRMGMSVSASPDESGIANFSVTGSGSMDGVWETPFGFNELSLNSAGADITLNVEIKPAVPTGVIVVVTPALALRGAVNIGRTRAINLELAGVIDFSAPYASGIYGHFENIGLGTVLTELYLNEISNINAADLATLDGVYANYGTLSIFPMGADIAGQSYPMGLGLAGKGKVLDVGADLNLFFQSSGVNGEVAIDPIAWRAGDLEVFSLRGFEEESPLKGSLNLQFNSLAAQLTDAFNGSPFLTLDAYVGLLGSSSQTKLLLNPFRGSYFSTKSRLLDVMEAKLDGEIASLTSLGDMSIRGAFDKVSAEELNNALIDELSKLVRGIIPVERLESLNHLIQEKIQERNNLVAQLTSERATNTREFEAAKNHLQGLQNEYNRLDGLAAAAWANHEATPWHWVSERLYWWGETTRLNGEKSAVSVPLNTARLALNGLIWINNLPPVELDPRVIKLTADGVTLVGERELLTNFNNMNDLLARLLGGLSRAFLSNAEHILDIRQIEFQGRLGLLTGAEFETMMNMIFLGDEISIRSKISINQDGTFNLNDLVDNIINGRYQQGFAPSIASEIGNKYNYETVVYNAGQLTPPQNGGYVPPPVTNSNPSGNPGEVAYLDGLATVFNGSSDYQEKSGNWGNGWAEMTIEAWVKSNGSTGDFQTIVSGNEGFVHFQMNQPNGGNNVVYLTNGLDILLPVLPDVGTGWRHVAIVLKSGESVVYQNGEIVGQPNHLAFGNGTIVPSNAIRIGANAVHNRYLNGALAKVRIWNTAKTQAAIRAGMHGPITAAAPGLVAKYFDGYHPDDQTVAVLERNANYFSAASNVSTPNHITQNLNALTVEAWVKNEGGSENIQAIVSSGSLDFIHLQASEDPSVNSAVYVNNGEIYLPAVPKATGEWQHVAVVVQSGNTQMYINGAPYGPKQTKTFTGIKPATSVLIGKGFAGSRAFNGKLSNIRIWNVAKSAAELSRDIAVFNLANSPNLLYRSPTSNPLVINSAADCVAVPAAVSNGLQSLTIEAWISVGNIASPNEIKAILSSTGPDFVHLQLSQDRNVQNVIYLENGEAIYLPSIPELPGGWHHVALVAESGNSRVYLNGEQLGEANTRPFSAGIKASNTIHIGKGWAGNRVFSGQIADVRVWKNRVLTQQEIQTYRHTPPPATAAGLGFQYR